MSLQQLVSLEDRPPNGAYDDFPFEDHPPAYDRLISQEESSQATLERNGHNTVEALNDHMKELFRGYDLLLGLIFAEEKLPDESREMFFRQGRNILASTDNEVLQAIIQGNIPEAMVNNYRPHLTRFLRDCLREVEVQVEEKQHRPVIYSQYLVNSQAQSPTIDEVKRIVGMVQRYIDGGQPDHEWARQIDTAKDPLGKKQISWNQGQRRYLGVDLQQGWKRIEDRKRKANDFCNAVTARCEGCTGNARPRPFSEVGYTNSTRRRLRDHARHASSNWLMNLVHAICLTHLPSYTIKQFVIFRIWDDPQSSIAEIIFNRLAQSPIETGFGFAYYRAGISVFTSGLVPSRSYTLWAADALKSTPLLANLERERKMARERLDKDRNNAAYRQLLELVDGWGDEISRLRRNLAELAEKEREAFEIMRKQMKDIEDIEKEIEW